MLQHIKILYKEVERIFDSLFEKLIPASVGICIVFGFMADQLHPVMILPAIFLICWSAVWLSSSLTVWFVKRFVGVAPHKTYKGGSF